MVGLLEKALIEELMHRQINSQSYLRTYGIDYNTLFDRAGFDGTQKEHVGKYLKHHLGDSRTGSATASTRSWASPMGRIRGMYNPYQPIYRG